MDLAEFEKLQAISLNFCGDVRKIINHLAVCSSKTVKNELTQGISDIAKFCHEVERRLDDLGAESMYGVNEMILQDKFISQVKAIKRLCEKAMTAESLAVNGKRIGN